MTKKSISVTKPAKGRSIGQNVAITRNLVKAASKNDRTSSGIAK